MMNLEIKINKVICMHSSGNITDWVWAARFGYIPRSILRIEYDKGSIPLQAYLKIDMLIQEASLSDCARCSCQYIRMCKKWMETNNLQEVWTKTYNKKVS